MAKADDMLCNVHDRMQANDINESQGNEIRQAHHLTMQDLKAVEKVIRRFVCFLLFTRRRL